jgi:hypothetical protein
MFERPDAPGRRPADDDPTTPEDSWAALCSLLWAERELLEHLLFKLTEEQHIVASGSTRWLNQADDEVSQAVAALQDTEVVRAAEVEAITRRLGAGVDTTLRELAERAPEPWGLLLADHREVLRALALEIDAAATDNRRLLLAGFEATRETLDRATSVAATYDAHGVSVPGRPGAYLLDQQA